MTIQEVLQQSDINKRIDGLKKGRDRDLPDIGKIQNQWQPGKHEIFNEAERPNKTVKYDVYNSEGVPTETTRIEKVARIALAFQKLIVKRAASFLFGNPVKIVSSKPDSKVANAVNVILADNKHKGLNRRIARTLVASTEVAEYWYPVESESFNKYGFDTKFKIRCSIFSPLKGDKLYPFFDSTGDMVAFSREYKVKEGDTEVTYFETWTKENYSRYKQTDGAWTEVTEPIKLVLGKIPIVYASQETTEWDDVQWIIERLEKLLSNFADTIDYNASPKHVVSGEVKGFAKKGESGGILELENGADVKVLTWDQAPEGVKFEINNLLRMMYSITQTPDISFEAVKGLGSAASGQSLKMLFLDAHLKVMDKMEIFDDYLERRFNILKTFVGKLNSKLAPEAEDIELIPEVVPFMVDDEAAKIDNLVDAVTGGILSKQTAVSQNPLVEDADEEMKRIESEREGTETSPAELDNIQNEE
jgi:SPP1 family phage portal protein